ncbi:MAG: ParB/RepB/Spo0J family partition protein [Bacteroidales bacterium]|nr:ParB/RepB/Spo0J family partition protein [Bacteroidales bacterium]
MSKEQRGLGRGLSALLGETKVEVDSLRKPVGYVNKTVAAPKEKPSSSDIMRVPVSAIEPNPFQPRETFDPTALEELAASIKALGLIQPITVRKKENGTYQIISGERRFRASKMAGLSMLPAYIIDTDDQGMLEMAIVENIQRVDLDPIEMAMSYQRLIDDCKLTQEQMSERIGKSRAAVANTLRLLKLPAKVQHDLKVGLLSVGHAKVILGIDVPKIQEDLCDICIKNRLSVRQLEDIIRRMSRSTEEEADFRLSPVTIPDEYRKVADHIGKYFAHTISMKRTLSGKGTMTIHFKNDEEVQRFLEALDNSQI